MLLDLADSRKVVYRSPTPILAPEADDEVQGVVPNVVFPTGIDAHADGQIEVYYGMADSAIGVARLAVPSHLEPAALPPS